jgi:alcohol dehydrogenase, propanol-preferring
MNPMQEASKYIAGHEGAGHVVAVGEGMKHKWKVGDRAGVRLNYTCFRTSHTLHTGRLSY